MNNLEIDYLLNNLGPEHLDKIESFVGKDKTITSRISNQVLNSLPHSPCFLQLCSLLLLEKQDKVIEVIRNILFENPTVSEEFLKTLLASEYYYQRMAVPKIIVNMGCKDILFRCFEDKSGCVIREAAMSLKEYETVPFSEEELLQIADYINNHPYDYVQCTVVDILIHMNDKNSFITQVCQSESWRKRLAIAKKVGYFKPNERDTIFSLLHKDQEESIRSALVQNLTTLDNMKEYAEGFIKDSSEKVRSLVVRVIGNLNEFQDLLKETVDDKSWLVRKELLCIHNENVYECISLPLITSLPSNYDWRVKIEILESIFHIAQRNDLLIQRCLSQILFNYLSDKVYQIREKAGDVIKFIVENADWAREWESNIENLVKSKSYLLRMSVVPVALSFDRRFKTSFTLTLLQDKILNVPLKALEALDKSDCSPEVTEILREIKKDVYIEEAIAKLDL